jgi:signal transduction protein with GAF and PtsI domain
MTISNMIINQPQSPERHKNVDSRSVAGDIPEVLEFHSIQKSTIHTKQVIIDSLHTNVHIVRNRHHSSMFGIDSQGKQQEKNQFRTYRSDLSRYR